MDGLPRQQREYELVRLLLGDRTRFRQFCAQALRLSMVESALRVDRDLIRAVLDLEFPPFAVQWCLPVQTMRAL